MIFNLILAGLILLLNNQLIYCLSCKSPDEIDVDWWVAYKPPSSKLIKDEGYFYIDSTAKVKGWNFIESNILTKKRSVLYNSVTKIMSNPDESSNYDYVMFNDVLPANYPIDQISTLSPKTRNDQKAFKYGTSKGMFFWNQESAFLLIHSIPLENLNLRLNSHSKSANIFLCINTKLNDIRKIWKYLILMKVRVYKNKYPKDTMRAVYGDLYGGVSMRAGSMNPIKARRESYYSLRSKGGQRFTITALTRYEQYNIWGKVSAKHKLNALSSKSYPSLPPSICGNSFAEIMAIKITGKNLEWESNEDLSRWGVCKNANCFCVTNLNRIPEEKRSATGMNSEYGGAICILNKHLKDTMQDSIEKSC